MTEIKQLRGDGKPYKNYTLGALCKCRHSFYKHNKNGCCKCSCKEFDYIKDWSKKKTIVKGLVMCSDDTFKGIECISKINDYGEKEYGFEGCYNNDVNIQDPRPAHRIWIKEVYAEKLFRLFQFAKSTEDNLSISGEDECSCKHIRSQHTKNGCSICDCYKFVSSTNTAPIDSHTTNRNI